MTDFFPDFKYHLGYEFYKNPTDWVAKNLIGKCIVRKIKNSILAGIIVETEAYLGANDSACHSFYGKTKRNAGMFEDAGIIYVYKSYGIHNCTNIVTEEVGLGSAVLIRAVEPILAIDEMKNNRGLADSRILCKGPGNFSKAFDFKIEDNLCSLLTENIYVQNYLDVHESQIKSTSRIGITRALELQLRFFLKENKFVSGKKS